MALQDMEDFFIGIQQKEKISYHPESFFSKLKGISTHSIPFGDKYILVKVEVGKFIDSIGGIEQFLWEKQRAICQERVDEIICYLSDKPGDTQIVNLIITIASVNGADPKILDGQHRLNAVLKMDRQTNFMIQYVDFPSDNDRTIEFIKVNSNEQLPNYYKGIHNHGSYCQIVSAEIARVICDTYPDLVDESSFPKYGYLNQVKMKEEFYDLLRQKSVPMTPDFHQSIIPEILKLVSDPSLFPAEVSNYPIPAINQDKCLANISVKNKREQCPNKRKKNSEYCGHHKKNGDLSRYHPIIKRNKRFEELDQGYFILDPKWMEKVIDTIFPPLFRI